MLCGEIEHPQKERRKEFFHAIPRRSRERKPDGKPKHDYRKRTREHASHLVQAKELPRKEHSQKQQPDLKEENPDKRGIGNERAKRVDKVHVKSLLLVNIPINHLPVKHRFPNGKKAIRITPILKGIKGGTFERKQRHKQSDDGERKINFPI
jgi:hypothetical protein